MKNYKQFTLFIFLACSIQGFSQSFRWTKDIKSVGFDEGYDLVVDPFGNVYVAGMMEFSTDFGNNVVLESAGVHDIFVAKYDSTGKLIWAKRAGGSDGDKVQSIAYDPNGFIYTVGEFEDTAHWDNIRLVTDDAGINNMFVAKYDTAGNVLWVRSVGTNSPVHTRGYGVSCDNEGNVYACGGAKGDVKYQGNFLFSSAGDYDGTLFKFDPNGNYIWGRIIGGTDSDKAYGVVADNNGYVYLTGYFAGHADFSQTVSLDGIGHTDIFLTKFDTAGTLQWAKQAGDTGFDRGWNIARNVNGQILITGSCEARARFDSHTVFAKGNEDMFLASYDSLGNNLWALSGGGVENDIGRGVSNDKYGNIYVAGDYAGSAIFHPDTITANGFADVFFACYDINGANLKWLRTAGGHDNDRGRSVGCDLAGNVYFCGEYVDSTRFDGTNLIGDSLLDVFVTRVSPGTFCTAQITSTTFTPITCQGLCNGSAVVTATGQGPISYLWSTIPAQTGPSISSLCAGTYSVTATDAAGCSANISVTLIDPPAIQISGTIDSTSCIGCSDGSISVSASGGTGNLTYSWSNGMTTQNISALVAGTYSVCVSDLNSCSVCESFTIADQQICTAQINATTVNPITCQGICDGSASVNASGQGVISYVWSTIPVQTTSTVSILCAGTYTVTATDAGGCSASATVTLIDPPTLQMTETIVNTTCIGCTDGSISLTGSGGTGSYTYSWSNGMTTQNITGLLAGTYSVCMSDSNSCSVCEAFTLIDMPNGISNPNGINAISVRPNPFSDFTIIKTPNTDQSKVVLYNAIGELVYSTVFMGNEFILSGENFSNGIYFLQLINNKFSNEIKIIVSH